MTILKYDPFTAHLNAIKSVTGEPPVYSGPRWISAQAFAASLTNDLIDQIRYAQLNVQTGTTYTLVLSDNGKVITFNNAGAVTVTIPAGLPAGFACGVVQLGAGQVGFTTSSTTLHSYSSLTHLAGQYAAASLLAYLADTFLLAGTLA